jgi:CubicO group peptidase (beta-lactamase class C family)
MMGSVGQFSWPGASGTDWWADPKEELAVVYLSAALALSAGTTGRRSTRWCIRRSWNSALTVLSPLGTAAKKSEHLFRIFPRFRRNLAGHFRFSSHPTGGEATS